VTLQDPTCTIEQIARVSEGRAEILAYVVAAPVFHPGLNMARRMVAKPGVGDIAMMKDICQ
jgi:hypothetical protein